MVKLTVATSAPLMVTGWLAGVNVKPLLDGVTVYVPLANPAKAKFPELSAVVVPLAPPLRVSVVPLPFAAGLTVPEMLQVGAGWARKLPLVAFAPLPVAAGLSAVTVKPLLDAGSVDVWFANPPAPEAMYWCTIV